mmetsp:Transcript_13950/g.48602  ORF Transcript_13950/g.48602 Transcript_13950/m.48602 type:complete len:369 (-) Transcript_13950:1462-2568(-)
MAKRTACVSVPNSSAARREAAYTRGASSSEKTTLGEWLYEPRSSKRTSAHSSAARTAMSRMRMDWCPAPVLTTMTCGRMLSISSMSAFSSSPIGVGIPGTRCGRGPEFCPRIATFFTSPRSSIVTATLGCARLSRLATMDSTRGCVPFCCTSALSCAIARRHGATSARRRSVHAHSDTTVSCATRVSSALSASFRRGSASRFTASSITFARCSSHPESGSCIVNATTPADDTYESTKRSTMRSSSTTISTSIRPRFCAFCSTSHWPGPPSRAGSRASPSNRPPPLAHPKSPTCRSTTRVPKPSLRPNGSPSMPLLPSSASGGNESSSPSNSRHESAARSSIGGGGLCGRSRNSKNAVTGLLRSTCRPK